MLPGQLSIERHALLVLRDAGLEWHEFHGDELASAYVNCESEVLSDVVRAARSARAELGSHRRALVLALGPEWIDMRVAALPPVSPRDQTTLLRRRAASALGVEAQQALFAARSSGGEDHETQRWLLCSARQAALSSLLGELARAGLHVKRVLADAALGLPVAGDAEAGGRLSLCFVAEPGGASVWLLGPDGALHTGRVRAREAAVLRAGLVQEALSVAAFARRTLRGRDVEQLRLAGWPADESLRLEAELRSVLPEARLTSTAPELWVRRRLQAALAPAARELDLLPPRAVRPRAALVSIVAALVLSLSLAAWTRTQWRSLGEQGTRELRRLELLARSGRGAGDSEARLTRLEELLEAHEARRAQAEAWPALLAQVAEVLGGDVELRALEGDPARVITLSGWVDARPLLALDALQRARSRLRGAAGWIEASIELEPAAEEGLRRGVRWQWRRAS